jgi:hypothetical protein
MENKQNSSARKIELFRKIGVEEVDQPIVVHLRKFEVGHLHGEYLSREGDLLIHFFWKEPPPPGSGLTQRVGGGFPDQEVFAPWPYNFRECMRAAALDSFKLHEEPRRIEIEWVPELLSWCLTVRGVTKVITPSRAKLERLATSIFEISI